jgi:hypothetical protein
MAKNFLRPTEVAECEADKRQLEQTMAFRHFDRRVQSSEIARSIRAVDERLKQAPPDLTPEQRDKASRRIAELEQQIPVGMLSHEEMRRNPPGAVPRNVAWHKANAKRVHEWKNLQLALHKGASTEDIQAKLNVARLRPRTSQLNMDGAQIPAARTFVSGFGEQIDWEYKEPAEPDAVEALDQED